MEMLRLNVTLEATAPFALDFYITTPLRTCVSVGMVYMIICVEMSCFFRRLL